MKLGVFCPLLGPVADAAYVRSFGETAEQLGFDSLWAAEHVVLFDEYGSKYPYSADGRIPAAPSSGMLEPFTTLAYLAALTNRIRLGTGVLLVPQRNPVYTAKEAANVDWLSGGRLDLGVGVGWLAEEFRAVGVPWARRGERTRSYVEVMRRLWCDEVSEFKDEFYDLPACRQFPKPIQKPHVPIHFGGESDAALQRVADIGQGWYGFNLEPEGLVERLARLDALLDANGRKRSDLVISVSPYLRAMTPAKLEAYRRAGADQVILIAFARDRAAISSALGRLAQEYLPLSRRLA
ncbi:MAG: LLM class F420-dependent oxidoreductase [Deltaproteobacteria bacterium]|nr:LLM class F420-dependent oxidoreductase [Deltaproteobacteria bacterium]